MAVTTPVVPGTTVLQGTVTEVADGEEFMVDAGARKVMVETDELAENPLDDEGYRHIEVGDTVSVTGVVDYDFLEGRELVASSVVELAD